MKPLSHISLEILDSTRIKTNILKNKLISSRKLLVITSTFSDMSKWKITSLASLTSTMEQLESKKTHSMASRTTMRRQWIKLLRNLTMVTVITTAMP